MVIRMFILKVINNERKILTHNEIIDRIAEQIVLVITRVCKESMSSSELTAVKCLIYFSFIYLFIYLKLISQYI